MFNSGLVIGLIVGGVIVAIFSLIAMTRKANARAAQPTRRAIAIETALSPDAAFKALQAAPLGRYKVGDSDPGRRVIVFASPMTIFSWGFFFPVFIAAGGAGATVTIGIQSRLLQWGPVVANTHKAFAAEARRVLEAR